jgi:hypothetical protein
VMEAATRVVTLDPTSLFTDREAAMLSNAPAISDTELDAKLLE